MNYIMYNENLCDLVVTVYDIDESLAEGEEPCKTFRVDSEL